MRRILFFVFAFYALKFFIGLFNSDDTESQFGTITRTWESSSGETQVDSGEYINLNWWDVSTTTFFCGKRIEGSKIIMGSCDTQDKTITIDINSGWKNKGTKGW